MIKNIEDKIKELEERRNQCKLNIKNQNISEDVKWYEKGVVVEIREEIKYLKNLIELVRG